MTFHVAHGMCEGWKSTPKDALRLRLRLAYACDQ